MILLISSLTIFLFRKDIFKSKKKEIKKDSEIVIKKKEKTSTSEILFKVDINGDIELVTQEGINKTISKK